MNGDVSTWRVTEVLAGAPAVLLADGLAAFDALSEDPRPTLRWYRSTRSAVVLGRGQGERARSGSDGSVLVRHSGGGAVLLSPDVLSCDVLLPSGHPLMEGSPMSVFTRVGAAWRDGLVDTGVDGLALHHAPAPRVDRSDPRQRLRAGICFAALGLGEVTLGGRKLVGLSQRRRRHGTMVQVGMLRRWRPGPLLEAIGADRDDADISAAAVGLDDVLIDAPTNETIAAAVSRRLAAAAPPLDLHPRPGATRSVQ